MSRRLERRTETVVDVDYDYEGNAFDVETEVEILSVFEGETLLWEGTEGDAHCPEVASSDLLPHGALPPATRTELRDDALWSMVAPEAEVVVGEPDVRSQRSMIPIHQIGSTQVVTALRGHIDQSLIIRDAVALPVSDPEWLLVVGDDVRLLAQHCYLAGSRDNEARFTIGGIYVAERRGTHDPI